MGETRVTATVRNPADPEKTWEGVFLVDTGAIDCLIPKQHLEAIGLAPKGARVYGLADGGAVRMELAVAQVELMGEVTAANIVFAEDDAEPLLGLTVLESIGIEVDPHNQTLRKLPYTRLRGFRPKG